MAGSDANNPLAILIPSLTCSSCRKSSQRAATRKPTSRTSCTETGCGCCIALGEAKRRPLLFTLRAAYPSPPGPLSHKGLRSGHLFCRTRICHKTCAFTVIFGRPDRSPLHFLCFGGRLTESPLQFSPRERLLTSNVALPYSIISNMSARQPTRGEGERFWRDWDLAQGLPLPPAPSPKHQRA